MQQLEFGKLDSSHRPFVNKTWWAFTEQFIVIFKNPSKRKKFYSYEISQYSCEIS